MALNSLTASTFKLIAFLQSKFGHNPLAILKLQYMDYVNCLFLGTLPYGWFYPTLYAYKF